MPLSEKENNVKGGLEDYEREDSGRYPFLLNYRECKLLGIAGVRVTPSPHQRLASQPLSLQVGFFLDAYDLFIINVSVCPLLVWPHCSHDHRQPVATMLQYRLYGGQPIPSGLQGFLKASANIGSVVGQFSFGYAADSYGRKAVCKCSCDHPLGALSLTPLGSLP